MNPTSIVAYLALFALVGFLFLFASLLIGRLLRPRIPSPEKSEVYECGEPAIGSSRVQFDLRYYVVALVFIIFDVEVAFFFPWATVFGKANALSSPHLAVVAGEAEQGGPASLTPTAKQIYRELGVGDPGLPAPNEDAVENSRQIRELGRRLGLASMADMGVFFAVLLVGFAYVWRLGDLDWVRSVPRRDSTWSGPVPESPTAEAGTS